MDDSTVRSRRPDGMRLAFLWVLLPILVLFLIAPSVGAAAVPLPPPTAISPTGGTGSPTSLGTTITSGTSTIPTNLCGGNCVITGGTRPGGASGTNLFHSFGQFNVGTGDIANFFNETGLPTSNILSRVTGGNQSQIYGTIRTTDFGNANLFLMNPAGVLFGPTAVLDLGAVSGPAARDPGGSFYATTADYLKLGDASLFYANDAPPAKVSVLSIAPVAAFGFLPLEPGITRGTISIQGSNLSVANGQTIGLVGGNIEIQAGSFTDGTTVTTQASRLSAPNGQIQLASAASPGEFDVATLGSLPNVDGASFTSFGSVSLAPGSSIDVSGANTVFVKGGQLVLSVNDATLSTSENPVESPAPQDTISLSRGSSIVTSNSGADAGADVQIIVGNLQMDGASITSVTTGNGKGGNISITDAQTVNLINGAQVVSRTDGLGVGGDITVSATVSVSLSGFDTTGTLSGITTLLFDPNTFAPVVTSGVFSTASAGGNGGSIVIGAPIIAVDSTGTIATINTGDGRGGDVALTGGTISFTNGGQLLSSTGFDYSTFTQVGTGPGGDVTVTGTGTDSILLSGINTKLTTLLTEFAASNIQSITFSGSGNGGNILANVRTLAVTDGAVIQSLNLSSGIDLTGDGVPDVFGEGGNVTVQGLPGPSTTSAAESVTLSNGAQISSVAVGPGRGGDVLITSGVVQLYSGCESCVGASINSDTNGDGNGGNIVANVNTLSLANESGINSRNFTGGQGRGGNVTVQGLQGPGSAAETVTVDSLSGITTQTWFGPGRGGNINITANKLEIKNHSIVTSDTLFGTGKGGDLVLNVGNLTISGGSLVRTSDATTGSDGDLDGKVDPTSVGAGGGLTIQGIKGEGAAADSVVLLGGSLVGTQAQDGSGGKLSIATSILSLDEVPSLVEVSSIFTSTAGFGLGGNIDVRVQAATLGGGATIASRTSTATGGNITVRGLGPEPESKAESLTLSGFSSGITSDSFGLASPGKIEVYAETVSLTDRALIAGGSPLTIGTGGIVTIDADLVSIAGESRISSQAFGRDAGKVTITADQLTLDNGSIVTSTASNVFGSGGNVEVNGGVVSLVNGSTINSSTSETGQAGNITMNVGSLTLANHSEITSSSRGPRPAPRGPSPFRGSRPPRTR